MTNIKNIIATSFILLMSLSLFAQKDVKLRIKHIVDGADLAAGTSYPSDLGGEYAISRLQYYLCEFKVIDSNNQEVASPGLYALVNGLQGGGETTIELGNLSITDVSQIQFNVGVDSVTNHSDPSAQPNGHPLAPQSPTMHWGWAAGYRFIAYEGSYSPSSGGSQNTEYHVVGDQYFTQTAITLSSASIQESATEIIINVSFDVNNLLSNAPQGVQDHGSSNNIAQVINNINGEPVFASLDTVATQTSIQQTITTQNTFYLLSSNKDLTVKHDLANNSPSKAFWLVSDISGRTLFRKRVDLNSNIEVINLEKNYGLGTYYLSLELDNQIIKTLPFTLNN